MVEKVDMQKDKKLVSTMMQMKYQTKNLSEIDKADYLSAMERSPIKDIEIKHLLKNALTDKINEREIYMKGIDVSYYYEGYDEYDIHKLISTSD